MNNFANKIISRVSKKEKPKSTKRSWSVHLSTFQKAEGKVRKDKDKRNKNTTNLSYLPI